MRGKECEIFLLQQVQIEGVRYDTVLAESAEIHDTCIRPRGCVCGSMFNDGRTRTHVFSSVHGSNREAARGLAHC